MESDKGVDEFYIKEQEYLRREIESSVQETRTLERYALIGTSAVWVWLLTTKEIQYPKIALFIPVLFAVLGGLRSWALLKSIERASLYIQEIEKRVRKEHPFTLEITSKPENKKRLCKCKKPPESGEVKYFGWETFIHISGVRKPFISRSAITFWGLLFLVTFLFPFMISTPPPPLPKPPENCINQSTEGLYMNVPLNHLLKNISVQ